MTDSNKTNVRYAISLKQPWATLVVHGLKTIEIRSWPTSRRGKIWIHAALVSDPRKEGWLHLPDDLQLAAKQTGGIIGYADLVDCVKYTDVAKFTKDSAKHLNEESWFREPALYGFVFANAEAVEFEPYKGWVRIFRVE